MGLSLYTGHMARLRGLCVAIAAAGCRQLFGLEPPVEGDVATDAVAASDVAVEDGAPSDGPATWRFRRPLTLDASQVASPLSDFPVLVRWSADPQVATYAQSDGRDIKFTTADGTQLAHEIERYDQATGELIAWVRAPTVDSSADTVLYMYYGHATATPQQDPTQVWSSEFRGVWHLGETSGTVVEDSTSNNLDGARTSTTQPSAAAGAIGGGASYGGTVDVIDVGASSLLDNANLTFEAWVLVNAEANTIYRRIFDFPTGFAANPVLAYPTDNVAAHTRALMFDMAGPAARVTPDNSFTAGEWHHVAFTLSPYGIYIDGQSQTLTVSPVVLAQDNTRVTLGARQTTTDRALNGLLDEVRISSVTRSSAWIATTFANQKDNSTFVTVGSDEAL